MKKCIKKRMNLNTKLFAAGLLMVALPLTVMATEEECFPLCSTPIPIQTGVEIAIDTKLDPLAVVARRETDHGSARSVSCDASVLKQA